MEFVTATSGWGVGVATFAATMLLAGVGSSWLLIQSGTALNTSTIGAWVEWPAAARGDADPYTRSRMARYGILPLNGRIAATFEARRDNDGQRLHSSCEYSIRSQPIKGNWWSLAVYDGNGLLIPNAGNRYSFDSSTIITRPDGSFIISLAREARAGNWLPVGGAGRLTLVLTVLQPKRSDDDLADAGFSAEDGFDLPEIQKVSCR